MNNDKTTVRKILDAVKASGRDSLTAPEGKLVCDAYGITVPQESVVNSSADAQKIATQMGYPVVMKIVSPDILHKTEAGGVIVGVTSAQEAANASNQIIANPKAYKSDASTIGGQEHQRAKVGQQAIMGVVTAQGFEPLVPLG